MVPGKVFSFFCSSAAAAAAAAPLLLLFLFLLRRHRVRFHNRGPGPDRLQLLLGNKWPSRLHGGRATKSQVCFQDKVGDCVLIKCW